MGNILWTAIFEALIQRKLKTFFSPKQESFAKRTSADCYIKAINFSKRLGILPEQAHWLMQQLVREWLYLRLSHSLLMLKSLCAKLLRRRYWLVLLLRSKGAFQKKKMQYIISLMKRSMLSDATLNIAQHLLWNSWPQEGIWQVMITDIIWDNSLDS